MTFLDRTLLGLAAVALSVVAAAVFLLYLANRPVPPALPVGIASTLAVALLAPLVAAAAVRRLWPAARSRTVYTAFCGTCALVITLCASQLLR